MGDREWEMCRTSGRRGVGKKGRGWGMSDKREEQRIGCRGFGKEGICKGVKRKTC